MLSQNAMLLTLPIKEPTKGQKDGDGRRIETFLMPQPKLLVNHWTSQPIAARDFPGSLAYIIGKPVNISSLEQQQSKDWTPLQKSGKKATRQEATIRLGQLDQLEDSLK